MRCDVPKQVVVGEQAADIRDWLSLEILDGRVERMHQHHVHKSQLDLLLCHFLRSKLTTIVNVGSARICSACASAQGHWEARKYSVSLFMFYAFHSRCKIYNMLEIIWMRLKNQGITKLTNLD